MAENTEQPREVSAEAVGRDQEAEAVQPLIDELKGSEQLRSLGLADEAGEVVRSVLCALWRNMPLQQIDVLRGLLPGGIDLMLASCERPHGRHSPPDTFRREPFMDDVSKHLHIPRDRAHTASTAVLHALRERMPDEDVEANLPYIPAELMDLLRRPV